MEAKLKASLGVETELIRGDRGVFDVVADGELVFSKHTAGRFPDEREILETLRALRDSRER